MYSLTDKIKNIDSEKVKHEFLKLINQYISPSYGSMSKRDFDILLFQTLQNIGIIDKDPDIYDIIKNLKLTRTKARNILYEVKLRSSTTEELDEELKKLLLKPVFLKDNEKIMIDISNPFLIDHLKSKLKKLNHITDGSFSPELVKLTTDAYIALFTSYMPEDNKTKNTIVKTFVDLGVEKDGSLSGVLKGVLKKLAVKYADEAGGKLVESTFDYLSPIMSGGIEVIKEKFKDMGNRS